MTVAGWGSLSEGGRYPTKLQEVNVTMVALADCQAAFGATFTARMLCAGVP